MFSYLKIIGAALLVASLIIMGWKVKGWADDSSMLKVAKLELRNELQRRVKSDADRLSAQTRLAEATSHINTSVKTVQKTVIRYVKANPDCDLNAAVADSLQQLREGRTVPATQP